MMALGDYGLPGLAQAWLCEHCKRNQALNMYQLMIHQLIKGRAHH